MHTRQAVSTPVLGQIRRRQHGRDELVHGRQPVGGIRVPVFCATPLQLADTIRTTQGRNRTVEAGCARSEQVKMFRCHRKPSKTCETRKRGRFGRAAGTDSTVALTLLRLYPRFTSLCCW
jgi:hypothetical protein